MIGNHPTITVEKAANGNIIATWMTDKSTTVGMYLINQEDTEWKDIDFNANNVIIDSVSGSGNSQVTFTMNDLSTLTWNASHNHNYLTSIDDRDVKPNNISFNRVQTYLSSLGGLTGAADTNYQDLLVLNTYNDSSGGSANLLAFDKSEQKIRHYLADQTATTWGTPKTLAYSEDVVALSGDQTVAGTKTFSSTIAGTTNGNLTSSSSLNPANIAQTSDYRFVSDTEKADIEKIDITTNLSVALDGKAPKSHASTGNTYGLATTGSYGHVKVRDDLLQSGYENGVALSAYQGKILKDSLDTVVNQLDSKSIKVLTTAQYDGLSTKDTNTIYFIV